MGSALPLLFVGLAGLSLFGVVVAVWRTARALFVHDPNASQAAGEVAERDTLLAEKASLLNAIKDIEFEHSIGKLSDDDFARLDSRYRARAREVLRELDAQAAPYMDEARRLIAQQAAASAGKGTPSEPGACAACKTRNDADARFCKKCGAALSSEG